MKMLILTKYKIVITLFLISIGFGGGLVAGYYLFNQPQTIVNNANNIKNKGNNDSNINNTPTTEIEVTNADKRKQKRIDKLNEKLKK